MHSHHARCAEARGAHKGRPCACGRACLSPPRLPTFNGGASDGAGRRWVLLCNSRGRAAAAADPAAPCAPLARAAPLPLLPSLQLSDGCLLLSAAIPRPVPVLVKAAAGRAGHAGARIKAARSHDGVRGVAVAQQHRHATAAAASRGGRPALCTTGGCRQSGRTTWLLQAPRARCSTHTAPRTCCSQQPRCCPRQCRAPGTCCWPSAARLPFSPSQPAARTAVAARSSNRGRWCRGRHHGGGSSSSSSYPSRLLLLLLQRCWC